MAKANEAERHASNIEAKLLESKQRLRKHKDDCFRQECLKIAVQDKLLYTLGRQKGSSTGNLGYFFRYQLTRNRILDLRENLEVQDQQNDQHLRQL